MLFHEIYGSYYDATAAILHQAVAGTLTDRALTALIKKQAFSESLLSIPQGLKGEDIPILGRILCIADAFDAMTTRRCYQTPLTLEQAAAVLRDESGKQFDPKLALIFVRQLRDGTIRILGGQEKPESAPQAPEPAAAAKV